MMIPSPPRDGMAMMTILMLGGKVYQNCAVLHTVVLHTDFVNPKFVNQSITHVSSS